MMMEKIHRDYQRKSGITEIKKGLFSGFLGSSHVVGAEPEPKQKMTNYS